MLKNTVHQKPCEVPHHSQCHCLVPSRLFSCLQGRRSLSCHCFCRAMPTSGKVADAGWWHHMAWHTPGEKQVEEMHFFCHWEKEFSWSYNFNGLFWQHNVVVIAFLVILIYGLTQHRARCWMSGIVTAWYLWQHWEKPGSRLYVP